MTVERHRFSVSLNLFRDVEFLACAQGHALSVLRQERFGGEIPVMVLVLMLTSRRRRVLTNWNL